MRDQEGGGAKDIMAIVSFATLSLSFFSHGPFFFLFAYMYFTY